MSPNHPSLPRRAGFAAIAGLALALTASGPALANIPDADITVVAADASAGSSVCAFHLDISATPGGEEGNWEIRDADLAVVLEGEYAVTAQDGDRAPETGEFDLPNGSYTVWWDDEPVDNSRKELPFTVECEAPPAPPEETPPTGNEEPVAPKPTKKPSGQELPVGGGGPATTLPPTDTQDNPVQSQDDGPMGTVLVMLGSLIGAAWLARPTTSRRTRRRTVRATHR